MPHTFTLPRPCLVSRTRSHRVQHCTAPDRGGILTPTDGLRWNVASVQGIRTAQRLSVLPMATALAAPSRWASSSDSSEWQRWRIAALPLQRSAPVRCAWHCAYHLLAAYRETSAKQVDRTSPVACRLHSASADDDLALRIDRWCGLSSFQCSGPRARTAVRNAHWRVLRPIGGMLCWYAL